MGRITLRGLKHLSGIYRIDCMANNKTYIGSSNNISRRISNHFDLANRNIHNNQKFQASFNKYGKNSFIVKVLFYCDVNDLLLFEQRAFDVIHPEFNCSQLAASPALGYKHSQEAKKKISDAGKGKIFSEQRCKNISEGQKGKCIPEDVRKKISITLKGRPNLALKGRPNPHKGHAGYVPNETERKSKSDKMKLYWIKKKGEIYYGEVT